MIEIIMPGYYTESQCKAIEEKMNGQTFYNFQLAHSNCAGNCSLIVRSDYPELTPEELKENFVYAALGTLAKS